MFFTYVIKSIDKNYFYVGLTNNVQRRFLQHQSGKSKTTRAYRPFMLVLVEKFKTRQDARSREKYLKSGCGKEWIRTLFALRNW